MYKAVLEKDAGFEGLFFVAVKTTGIFCRPACTARTPKRENVEFFSNSKDALLQGYRPCKVCKPLEKKGETPDYIQEILTEISQDTELRIKDYDLRQRGIEPSKVRRWFIKNHGISFHAYQRSLKINQAFIHIKNGEKISAAAFDLGYESLSAFQDSFKKITGFAPSSSKYQSLISLQRITTSLGPMLAGANEQGICLLEFTDRRMLVTQIKRLHHLLKASFVPGRLPVLDELQKQMDAYFQGNLRHFDLPLYFPGTDFQQKVWRALIEIPYGQTRSYKVQAQYINQNQAVRAVAKANGDNRIAILVPCHRVLGSDGNLTGYGGGVWRKKWLLTHELKNAQDSQIP